MADSSVSRFGCYTIIWDTTRTASLSTPMRHSYTEEEHR
jgi:hypothetical protein